MKKLIIILSALFFVTQPFSVKAQNVSREQFNKVFAEYRAEYDNYVLLHDAYVLSKKQYEQYKTLSAKENLQKSLQMMLVKRDEVIILYYRSLISKMDDSSVKIPDERKTMYSNLVNDEITWLSEHKALYKTTDSPKVLSDKSKEVDKRYQSFQENIYKSLFYIYRGKMEVYSERYDNLYNELYALKEKIKNEQRDAYKLSDNKIETIERWFGEIQSKDVEYKKLIDTSEIQISKASGRGSLFSYSTATRSLNSALNIIKDKLGYTAEIIKEIKVSD